MAFDDNRKRTSAFIFSGYPNRVKTLSINAAHVLHDLDMLCVYDIVDDGTGIRAEKGTNYVLVGREYGASPDYINCSFVSAPCDVFINSSDGPAGGWKIGDKVAVDPISGKAIAFTDPATQICIGVVVEWLTSMRDDFESPTFERETCYAIGVNFMGGV